MRGAHEFTREDIEDLLAALGARLQARGVAATVYVVGGAAIALRDVSSDRRTADVDALMVPEELVLEAAREVAAERGVRSTWLNSAARPYVPPLSEALQPPGAPGLEVRTAPDEHPLAMKIVAAEVSATCGTSSRCSTVGIVRGHRPRRTGHHGVRRGRHRARPRWA
jgi:hypothetical protein